jgi:uroporphyrinogen decarboxylase
MNSRDRVRHTLYRENPDRVPVNYFANPSIDSKLKKHFGLKMTDDEGLRQALGVDIRSIYAPYLGRRLHREVENRNVDPQWGWVTRWVERSDGDGYWDFCDFPLKDADEETVAKWPMPSPDDYDYDILPRVCKRYSQYGMHVGNAGLAYIMNTAGFFRGMGQMFMDLALDDPAGLLLIDRFLKIQLEVTERELEKIGKEIDFFWIGEDLGTQMAPIISMEMFNKQILPRQIPFIKLAKSYNLPVMIHTCGSSSWSYEEYIKEGVTAFDTLQPECKNMNPEYLMKNFGTRASFHGGISTTNQLSFGTVKDVQDHVKQTLEVMKPGRGYFLAPTHSIQDNTPLENVLAMYETGREFGQY